MKILLCDDEPVALRHIKNLVTLTKIKCTITTAENGKDALDIIEKTHIDVVITDMNMPIMDGIDLSSTIKQHYPHILVTVVSGHTEFEYLQGAIKTGVVDYLLKPVGISQMEQLLTDLQKRLAYTTSIDTSQQKVDSPEFFDQMITYIKENFAKELSLKSVCKVFGISPSYGNKLFRKYSDTNFTDTLTAIRIDIAKQYIIKNPTAQVSEVAEMVGYADQLYFSKVFRKLTGKPPSKYVG